MANGNDDAKQAGQELARLQTGLDPYYYGQYGRNQPGSQYYHPRGSGAYYGMGQKRMRDKDIAIAGGIGILGAGIERFLKSKEADTSGVQYAEQEFAKAQAELEAPTPKVTEEEKAAMVQAATAPVRTEIEEIKSDTGSYLASTGRTANVADVVAARDVGTQALADAPLHAYAAATQKDLDLMKFDQATKAAARARSDNLAQVLDEVQVKQLKYGQAFADDLTKVALTSAAHAVAQDDRPAMERLLEKGASMAEITTLHKQAIAAGWPWGSREYEIYMMSHYEGRGGATDKQTRGQKKGESATVTAQPLPKPETPAEYPGEQGYVHQNVIGNLLSTLTAGPNIDSQNLRYSPGREGLYGKHRANQPNFLDTTTSPRGERDWSSGPAPHEVLKMQEMGLFPDHPAGKNAVDLFFELPKERQEELLATVRGR